MTKWYIYNKKNNYLSNLKNKNITKLEALILANRDIVDPKVVDSFINPTLEKLHDPFLLKDMEKAIDLIIETMENGESIRIFGDYDQDGISSTMTLLDGLLYFYDDISYDIPDRVIDGYGISDRMIDRAIEANVGLVITCDNGISAIDQVKRLKENGIKVIVTDHHQVSKKEDGEWVEQILPQADCVINPKRLDNTYPFDDLCGAGVAFKLIQALYQRLDGDMEYLYGLLEYVAMGTVCDVVSLTDENRIFVREGLKRINNTEKLAIKALVEENSWNREVSAYTLGFIIGPCMNATGRLSTAKLAIDMLMEDDIEKIRTYAKKLVSLNTERKELTNIGLEKTLEIIKDKKYYNDDIIIVDVENIEESICGIIAGRIKEKFNKPTIIMTQSSQNGILKGSGRSIEAYNIYKEVFEIKDILESFGGHPMACGLSIRSDKVEEFRQKLNDKSKLKKDDFVNIINIDAQIPIDKLSLEFAESLQRLEPFGKDNPKAKFADKNLFIKNINMIGKNNNTMKMILNKNGRDIEAIKFNAQKDYKYLSDKFKANIIGNRIDAVFYPDINEFNGRRNLQVKLIDIR
ncbi:MAG: single-stranded-DNA-specific exonuclease RecJ [Anaerococcus vaginalis]|uniref:single-stranded-DNA-specific exonuclease RecJ n=1 Tax=Anaerococcus vaginalis TaxID=33037 RepID=UPI00290E6D27|nr:single-stranded-DNA-specific exonuclease RecJ [Anaerococcus vaginalis]MDU4447616.1 single-stranded-DNA-specific exonuclease RecJ [Anaerococcus vaginalis]MDU6181069.1 single-stranded-DNA-specific exonuclease RecJ [Anaerococcus vaginalis]MDU7432089.1 single-stranded-DNA-specific exonuclease RecJ [Anaerococcus vaginalis]